MPDRMGPAGRPVNAGVRVCGLEWAGPGCQCHTMNFYRPWLAAALLVLPLRLPAHDYWLEPDKLAGAPGDPVNLRLLVGENLKADEEREFQRDRVAQCQLVSAAGRQDLRGTLPEGARPFAQVTLTAAGTNLFVLERLPSSITLEADQFTAYLKEEGLDQIVAERARHGESGRPGRERYARFLKCYLRAGDGSEAAVPALTLRLDIAPVLPAGRPLRAGDGLDVRVTFDGSPLRHAALFAMTRGPGGAAVTQNLVTDEAGRATVKLTAAGMWVLRLVHMQRAPAGDLAADWESFWAACTLGVR